MKSDSCVEDITLLTTLYSLYCTSPRNPIYYYYFPFICILGKQYDLKKSRDDLIVAVIRSQSLQMIVVQVSNADVTYPIHIGGKKELKQNADIIAPTVGQPRLGEHDSTISRERFTNAIFSSPE